MYRLAALALFLIICSFSKVHGNEDVNSLIVGGRDVSNLYKIK